MVPPVNLLLLKVRNRQGRESNSPGPSGRTGNGRRFKTRETEKNRKQISKLAEPLKLADGAASRRLPQSPRSADSCNRSFHLCASAAAHRKAATGALPAHRMAVLNHSGRKHRSSKSRRNELPVPRGRNPSVATRVFSVPTQRFGKQSIHDLVRSAITADSDKLAVSARIGVARNPRGITRRARLCRVQCNSAARRRSSAAPTRSPHRPPPAAGLMIARKASFTCQVSVLRSQVSWHKRAVPRILRTDT